MIQIHLLLVLLLELYIYYMYIIYIYIIKQDIHMYVAYSRQNDWTDWAEIFCGHSWMAEGCYKLYSYRLKN